MNELARLLQLITGWVNAGLKTDEILERLNNPSEVARRLLDRAVERRQQGAEYLGREPGEEG